MDGQTGLRALSVMESALRSRNRATRLRAVAMLANLECEQRGAWLEAAIGDCDAAVRLTALATIAWTVEANSPPWPQREDPRFDRVKHMEPSHVLDETGTPGAWQWEYVVEVWDADGLLVGSFLASTCEEDEEHARCIALGQAILASVKPGHDVFDPGSAGAFVVEKLRVPSVRHSHGARHRRW